MKVLHVLGSIEYSGAEIMLRESAPTFSQRDVDLHVLSTGVAVGRFSSQLANHSVTVHHLPFEKRPRFFARLYKFLREQQFDVVHVHTERAAFWVELTCRLARVRRIVRTVHSVFSYNGCLRLRRTFQRWIAGRVLHVTHVFVSSSVCQTERSRLGTRGVVIENFVDTARLSPPDCFDTKKALRIEHGLPLESVLIISVGQCSSVKQHSVIVQALAMLRDRDNTCDVHYVHVGSGVLESREWELAVALGVADRAHFLGQIDDIAPLLKACDVFVMPSLYEGASIAALEASACGLPVVGYDVPGLRDIVVDGETGFLVRDFAVASLARVLEELVRDPGRRQLLGEQGRANVVRRFSMERWITDYLAIYCGAHKCNWLAG